MALWNISVNASDMGEFQAASAAEALEAYAVDSGYKNYAELQELYPLDDDDDEIVTEIDTDAIVDAAAKHYDALVFQDSYGDGVALINNKSYKSWADLCAAMGKNTWDFKAA
jgi:hypothetical protein